MAKMSLAAARVNRGLTQAELADKIGVSRQAIFDWENGKRTIRPINLFALCTALNVTEDDVLLPTERKNRKSIRSSERHLTF